MMDTTKMKHHIDHQAEADDRTMFGFWVYLMTDLLMFAVLFAVFAVLRNSTDGGPGAADLLNPDLAFIETLLLLTSSFTVGIGLIAARQKKEKPSTHMVRSYLLARRGFPCD